MLGSEFNYTVKFAQIESDRIWPGWFVPNRYVLEENQRTQMFTKLEASILEKGFLFPLILTWGTASPDIRRFRNETLHMWRTGLEYIKTNYNLNPLVYKGLINTTLEESDTIFCGTSGTGRLMVAQKFGLKVPAIVLDYHNKLDRPPIQTMEELATYFPVKMDRLELNSFDIICETGQKNFFISDRDLVRDGRYFD